MRSDIPQLGFGLGLRGVHHAYILEHKPAVDWFEIISENYMFTDGAMKRRLAKIREHYPVVMHGVSLSIGTVDPLSSDYLKALKSLIDWLQPSMVSDHLCWTGVAHQNTHDLLPLPYTEEALEHIVARLCQVQDVLQRPLLIENPSTYLEFQTSQMPEEEFIARMVEGSGCQLLLDVNNVYVSCYNHRLDVKKYLDALPLDAVAQIHLAGHSNKVTHIIDTHDDHVIPEVWEIYRYIIAKAGMINSMIEWDDHIPEFPVLAAELDKARHAAATAAEYHLPNLAQDYPRPIRNMRSRLEHTQHEVQEAIITGNGDMVETWIRDKPNFPPAAQLQVYRNAYRWRLFDIVSEDFEALRHYLGDTSMDRLLHDYIASHRSHTPNAGEYPAAFADFVATRLPEDLFAQSLATLEHAIVQLATLPETPPLATDAMRDWTPEDFAAYQLIPRKALGLFAFSHPVSSYYTACMRKEMPVTPPAKPSWLAVYRHEDTMWRLELEAQEYVLLTQLFSGVPIASALEQLEREYPGHVTPNAVQDWFARWIRHGMLAEPDRASSHT